MHSDAGDVKFECDGRFSAPTSDCESGRCASDLLLFLAGSIRSGLISGTFHSFCRCRWSVEADGSVVIHWGDAGRHTLRQRSQRGRAVGAQRGSVLDGQRDRDGDQCSVRRSPVFSTI